MPWIDNVVPYSTILSTWGNLIRDHTVHLFANISERDANGPKILDGALAVTQSEKILAMRHGSSPTGWYTISQPLRPYTIQLYDGSRLMVTTSTVYSAYRQRGDWVEASFMVTTAGEATSVGQIISFTLPVAPHSAITSIPVPIGHGQMNIAFSPPPYGVGYFSMLDASRAQLIDARTNQPFKSTQPYPVTVSGTLAYQAANLA